MSNVDLPLPMWRDYQRELMDMAYPIDLARSLRNELFSVGLSGNSRNRLVVGDFVDLTDRPDILGFDPKPLMEIPLGKFTITDISATVMRGPRKARGWRRHVRKMKAKGK